MRKNDPQISMMYPLSQSLLKKIFITLVVIIASISSFAIDYTANNVTGNWNTPATWSPNGVPAAGDNVTIAQGTITVNVASAVSNITISGGTLRLNAGLTVTGAWLFNSGTFTPNTQAVIFGTGGSIGGSLATTFYNLTINTTNNTDVVTLNIASATVANNGTLSLTKGIFNVGAGHTINMSTGQAATIVNPGATGTSNFANGANGFTDADGGTISFTGGGGPNQTVNATGLTTFYNLLFTGNSTFTITNPATVLVNGTFTIPNNNWSWGGSNSPIYGPNSTLSVDRTSQPFPTNSGLEWTATPTATPTIGVTPGYPNNVILTTTNNSNFWSPTGNRGLNGSLTLNGKIQLDLTGVTGDFKVGGSITINATGTVGHENLKAPTNGNIILGGNWTRNSGAIFVPANGRTVNFAGTGTCSAPQIISVSSGTETQFNNLTVSNNSFVQLNSPVTLPSTAPNGILTLTSGVLKTSTLNIITINNTSTAAITGGGAGTYIDGPVKWSMQASSGVYNFPLGAGGCATTYLPLSLNKTAGNALTATAQAFNAGAGGTVDATLSSISSTEYWSLATSVSLATGSTVSVARPIAISPLAFIAKSNTVSGVYTSIGGTTGTFGVTNSNNIGTASPWYFSLGVPPIVSTLTPTSITTTGATLQGAFNTQGTSRNTSFTYGTNTSTGLGTPATIHSPINSNASVLDSAVVTGLTANTLYTYKATDGVNSGSDVTFITSPNPPIVGIGTGPTASGFTANWSAPAITGSAAYTYTVQASDDPSFATGVTTQSGIASGSTSYTFTNLSAATVYYYRVETVNISGPSVWSATSNAIATNVVASPPCNNNTSNDGATTFTNAAPVIDGVVDAVWANAPSNPINVVTLGNNNNTQNWQSLWTGDSLYLLVRVTDASLISQGASLAGSFAIPGIPQSTSTNYYESDGVEFYLDADYSNGNNYDGYNDIQLRFNLGSNTISGQSVGGTAQFVGAAFLRVAPLVNWKMQIVPGGYLLEAAIPWGKDATNPGVFLLPSSNYGTPTSGQTVGIDVNINDQDNTGGGRQAQIQWFNNSTDAYLHPNVFSNAGLQVCPVAPVVTTPTKATITATSAILGATVVSSGKDALLNISPLTSRGTAFSTSFPVVSNAQAEGNTTIGVYSNLRTELAPQTKYYYVGYANNAAGLTGVSAADSFYTLSALPTVQPVLTANTCAGITLNWNAITFPPVNQASQTGYLVLRREDGADPTTTGIVTRVATKQADLPAGTTLLATINSGATVTYSDATAVSGKTYKYLLVPFTWDGVIADSTFNYFTNEAPTVTATIGATITPTFNPVAPICNGGTLSALPTTSTNNITGSWTPALDNTATKEYTFTPDANQCASIAKLTITVNQLVTPTFNAVAPICSGSSLSALPTTSTNNITGSWFPALDNTSTKEYTFTPDANQCATIAKLTITVNQLVTPTFNAIAPICAGSTLNALPTTSTNNITGTWSPALDNTTTKEYTFTPAANQCATTAKLTITVNQPVIPTFNAVAPICAGSTLNALPTTSINNITGIWSPALDNTTTREYTFTPAANQCASTAKLTISVVAAPIVSANANPVAVNEGGLVTLTGTSSVEGTYVWSATPFTSIGASGTLNATSNPVQNTTYTLTVTNGVGCSASDDASVTIITGDCLNVPNVFTPNNDGYYDVWEIFTGQCLKQVQLDVYNRWGGLVFHSDKYDNKWNGTYKGKTLPDATYYYIVKATYIDGHTRQLTGNVTIMR